MTLKHILLGVVCLCAASVSAQKLPYQDPNLSAHQRAVDLCGRLTLEEKASLMLDESPAIPRLGIKKFYWWSEALHGVANLGGVTVFPEPVAMASSFNPDLLYRVFSATSDEMRAQYHHRLAMGGDVEKFHSLSVWTPNVNIFRDPRWGRGQETYGEDPWLTSVMGCAVVRGLQGPDSARYRKLWACAKHYAVHSGPESTRHTANINDVSPRDLWETYLPAFKSLVQDADVREVMCAYQSVDDEPCCSNNRLLQQILRDEWGFKHLVVSDCGAVSDIWSSHKVSSDATHASARATLAGTDVECGYNYAYKSLPDAVRRGLISEKEVDKHVIRLLEGRFDLGEMDDQKLVSWSRIPFSVVSSKQHAQLSLDMARQSLVLLKNSGNILPLDPKSHERIAVIGPNADNRPMMWGNYNGTPTHTIDILDGLRSHYKNLVYIKGCDLTADKVIDPLFTQCRAGKTTGLKGEFWNNTEREGKAVSTQYYTQPIAVTTAGMHNFAPGVKVQDFSARYSTTFYPKQSGEVALDVEGCGHFEVYVNGERKQQMHTWRTMPTHTVLKVEAGKSYDIRVDFNYVKTWNADLKINFGIEKPVDYTATIKQLKGIDKVIYVGGISPALEGEEMPVHIEGFSGGDRTNIELPKVQRGLIAALHDAGKQIIMVNCSGAAIALSPEADRCQAILQAWYPGQEGGTAVADVLFGKVNPSGKLPVTFYRSTSQLPPFESYDMKDRTYRYFKGDALYPFGYGLSYTQFRLGQPRLEKSGKIGGKLIVDVENTGQRDGDETVQVYVRDNDDTDGPIKSLRAFQRVSLKAGEKKTVVIPLNERTFELWDAATNTMRWNPEHHYSVYCGTSSMEKDLKQVAM